MNALFLPSFAISVGQAAKVANVSGETIRRWCISDGIGVQPGGRGPWRVSAPCLLALLANDGPALAAIKAGRLGDDAARPYVAARFEAGARLS